MRAHLWLEPSRRDGKFQLGCLFEELQNNTFNDTWLHSLSVYTIARQHPMQKQAGMTAYCLAPAVSNISCTMCSAAQRYRGDGRLQL